MSKLITSIHNTTRKIVEMSKNQTPKDTNEAQMIQRALLVYLGSQVVDSNLHPINRAYAGILLPYLNKSITPQKLLLSCVAGSAWVFAKNKPKALFKSVIVLSIAISTFNTLPDEITTDIIKL